MKTLPIVAGIVLLLALGGCAQTVALEPAADASNTLCAEVSVRLPDTVNDLERHETNAQGTGAWGSPSAVLLRCGVPVPDPTATLPCYSVSGIDWLFDGSDKPNLVYTTYGRQPATEVILDQEKVVPGIVLLNLAQAVGYTEKVRECTVISDSLDSPSSDAGSTPTPSPTPSTLG